MAGLRDGISGGGGGISSTTGVFTGNVTLGDAGADAISVLGTMTCTPAVTLTGGFTSAADSTFSTNKKVVFRSSGIYINSGAAGKLTIAADATGADDLTLSCTTTASDDITMSTTKKVIFRDTAIYIQSGDDGHLDFMADTSYDFNAPTDTDIVFNFTATTNSGVLTWMEDEDYFKFSDDILMNGTEKIQFYDTAVYINSANDGYLDIVADTGVRVNGATTITGNTSVTGKITATTGIIPAGASMVTVADGSNADYIVILPTPTPGTIVYLLTSGDATGFELRSSAPATVAINGGSGEGAESAIASTTTMIRCVCVSATLWICNYWDADGDEAKVTAAAP